MKEQKRSSKKAPPSLGWDTTLKQYKRSFWITGIILALVLVVGLIKLNAYLDKFSDKDFFAIEQAARSVMINANFRDIQSIRECSYEAPEKYSNVRLYCRIELAGYINYEDDEQAVRIAKKIEEEMQKMGTINSRMSDFYNNPGDAYTTITVNLVKPLPKDQCNFTIASGKRGGKVANRLPERDENNLIGLDFYCSAESREEYFPVTYRQGS